MGTGYHSSEEASASGSSSKSTPPKSHPKSHSAGPHGVVAESSAKRQPRWVYLFNVTYTLFNLGGENFFSFYKVRYFFSVFLFFVCTGDLMAPRVSNQDQKASLYQFTSINFLFLIPHVKVYRGFLLKELSSSLFRSLFFMLLLQRLHFHP